MALRAARSQFRAMRSWTLPTGPGRRCASMKPSSSPATRKRFCKLATPWAAKVSGLRQAEHMSEEQSDSDYRSLRLHPAATQQNWALRPPTGMTRGRGLVDRIRRVVLGFGMDELRQQDDKLEEQTEAAALTGGITAGMAVHRDFPACRNRLPCGALTRSSTGKPSGAWSHRLLYEGQWSSPERYSISGSHPGQRRDHDRAGGEADDRKRGQWATNSCD